MSGALVEKIYANEREKGEFNRFRKQRLKEQDVIQWIFEDGEFLSKSASILEKLEALESVFGMLNELTPEQREVFDEAVKRRPLFR